MYFYLLIPDEIPNEIDTWFDNVLRELPKGCKAAKWFFGSQILANLMKRSFKIRSMMISSSMQRVVTEVLPHLIGVSEEDYCEKSTALARERYSEEFLPAVSACDGEEEEEFFEWNEEEEWFGEEEEEAQ